MDALDDFDAPVLEFVRIGLTRDQIDNPALDIARLGIGVKPSDSRARNSSANMGAYAGRPTSCPPPKSTPRSTGIFTRGSTRSCGIAGMRKSSRRASCYRAGQRAHKGNHQDDNDGEI
jgi:hypothetical protein